MTENKPVSWGLAFVAFCFGVFIMYSIMVLAVPPADESVCHERVQAKIDEALQERADHKDLAIEWTIRYDYDAISKMCCTRIRPQFDLNQSAPAPVFDELTNKYRFDECSQLA